MVNAVLITRIIGLVVSATVIGLAISFIFTDKINFLNIVRICYLIFFALLLAMAEFNFGFFLKYFNFLDSYVGRGLFIVFLGSILLSNQLYAIIVGVIIIVVGIAYMVVGSKATAESAEGEAAGPKVEG